nr:hypothetical protein Iba_chr09bCG6990 [Ipomoea batatas]
MGLNFFIKLTPSLQVIKRGKFFICNFFTSYSSHHNLVRRQVKVFVLLYKLPHLLYTK